QLLSGRSQIRGIDLHGSFFLQTSAPRVGIVRYLSSPSTKHNIGLQLHPGRSPDLRFTVRTGHVYPLRRSGDRQCWALVWRPGAAERRLGQHSPLNAIGLQLQPWAISRSPFHSTDWSQSIHYGYLEIGRGLRSGLETRRSREPVWCLHSPLIAISRLQLQPGAISRSPYPLHNTETRHDLSTTPIWQWVALWSGDQAQQRTCLV